MSFSLFFLFFSCVCFLLPISVIFFSFLILFISISSVFFFSLFLIFSTGKWPEMVTVTENEQLSSVFQKLVKNKLHHIFVVNDQGKPTGCITLSDALLFFWNNLMALWTEQA